MESLVGLDPSTQGSDSCEGNDSNMIILPGKKKNNKKEKNKLKLKVNPKLSKSQKRKLKKIEEEKEKEILLSQSIEALEKYKISDDLYSLMWSSRNLGQVETVREKRRREFQYSKAGLEVPYSDRPPKKRNGDGTSFNVDDESTLTQPSQVMKEFIAKLPTTLEADDKKGKDTSLKSSEQLAARNRVGASDGDVHIPETVIIDESKVLSTQDCARSSLPSGSSIQEEVMKPEDRVDETKQVNLTSGNTLASCSERRNVITPTIVHVSRPAEVEEKRKDLPIVMMEQEIMEAINENISVIICGETGCGKTTQVPQFLFEAGFGTNNCSARGGIIGVTQPRRVAVLATAKRVAFELGLRLGNEVGFQVRHDRRVGGNCSIKFMTDGILLRELQNDFLLRRYSVIILDEAHERSLNTDILIGMLSRIIRERQREYEEQQKKILSGGAIDPKNKIYPLKLILMSATLRVEDFISGKKIFLAPPPVIEVPTRQYPVTIHFSKRTDIIDYIGQAYKKVLSIHKRLPPGGILVFVTGQREVEFLCRKLRQASRQRAKNVIRDNIESSSVPEEDDMKEISEAFEVQGNSSDQITDRFSSYDEDHEDLSDDESDLSYNSGEDSDLEVYDNDGNVVDHNSMESDQNLENVLGEDASLASLKEAFESLGGNRSSNPDSEGKELPSLAPEEDTNHASSVSLKVGGGRSEPCAGPIRALPLYAMLPASAQLSVFDDVNEGERLVVVATNVAETSLTIPGIKYVVDTGREKVKKYNPSNGIETYEVQWISKASAAQRAGRAGRTGPGHCYRLYSSAVFSNILPDFSVAEISKIPVDGVVLLMKSMNIGKVANFPFPTPPEASAIAEAERCLMALEALDNKGRLTSLGKAMAQYPMSPRHSRMLLTVIQNMRKVKNYAQANLVLAYAVAAAAALSLSNPFNMQFGGSRDDAGELKHDEKSDSVENEKTLDKEEKLRKKKLKEIVKASRGKFSNPTSDALTTAYALQCFELAKNPFEFCSSYGLHVKTMEEMSKLRKQLLQLVFTSKFTELQQEFSWTHGTIEDVECAWRVPSEKQPLQLNEEEILGQAICAGWADRVAKRTKGFSGLIEGERKVNAVRYQACMVKETVFLHRWSSLSKFAPEFLVYSELLQTKRPYMHGATTVKANWLVKYALSLCTFSPPLTDPKPYYDPLTDQVFCWVIPTFGPYLWKLPLHSVPIEDEFTRVAVFACSLLEGRVLPCLKSVRTFLAASPASILKPESLGLKRVGNLLNKLRGRRIIIDSCAMLRKIWEDNPRELYSEILDWFQEGYHNKFEKVWIDMQCEVRLNPEQRFPKRAKRVKG